MQGVRRRRSSFGFPSHHPLWRGTGVLPLLRFSWRQSLSAFSNSANATRAKSESIRLPQFPDPQDCYLELQEDPKGIGDTNHTRQMGAIPRQFEKQVVGRASQYPQKQEQCHSGEQSGRIRNMFLNQKIAYCRCSSARIKSPTICTRLFKKR